MVIDYEKEYIYLKCHSIDYDLTVLFQMMVDCSLEPHFVMSVNLAMRYHLSKYDPFYDNQDVLRPLHT